MIQNRKTYDTKRPKEKEMIFGIRAVIEAIEAGKALDKVLVRRDMSSAIGRELLLKLEGTNTPVLIDFTGYGCVNCRKMEAYVLDDDSVKARMKNYVCIELYVDDKRDGIGDRNSRIQREQFGSNAQPFFVQLDAYGHSVTEPMAFTTDPMEFINWLIY